MKFEKLNKDKIRITLTLTDLQNKDIDYQSFMSNSVSVQKFFLDVLAEAEKKIGFETKDYKIRIEALATSDNEFIITVTRYTPFSKKSPIIKRKSPNISNYKAIYRFDSFDEFCNFCNFLNSELLYNLNKFASSFDLYFYKNSYFLILSNINSENTYFKRFNLIISEFSNYIGSSNLVEHKLLEYGSLVFPKKAIKSCIKHFK